MSRENYYQSVLIDKNVLSVISFVSAKCQAKIQRCQDSIVPHVEVGGISQIKDLLVSDEKILSLVSAGKDSEEIPSS